MLLDTQFRTTLSDEIWSSAQRVNRMVVFETTLARAQANVGIINCASADIMEDICNHRLSEINTIFEQAVQAGNIAIPFVNHLVDHVSQKSKEASKDIHFGTTSQDLIDTTNMMALSELIKGITKELDKIILELHRLSVLHANTPVLARTLLQAATPITFGLKSATWGLGIRQNRDQMHALGTTMLAIQLGGSNGTLSAMTPHGEAVRADMAQRLGLIDPGHCWHTLRSRILTIAATLAGTVAATAKIAEDCLLMMQEEVGEIQEGHPGTSTSMPQKKNPVHALVPIAALPISSGLLSAVATTQVQPHERGTGQWHSEWNSLSLLSSLALASVEQLVKMLSNLKVNKSKMATNINNTNGSLGAEALFQNLSKFLGRTEAHALIKSITNQTNSQTFSERVMSEKKIQTMIPLNKLQDIFSYKEPIDASVAEALRISEGLIKP